MKFNPSEQVESTEGFGNQLAKYIMFDLNGEDYCLPILKTQEVIAEYQLTRLPSLPHSIRGVLSLRGEPVPVLNLRNRFGLTAKKRNNDTRVIIVETNGQALGIEVDRVKRVISFTEHQVEETPNFLKSANGEYISGVREVEEGRFTIILDMDALLSSDEEIQLDQMRDQIVQHYSEAPPTRTSRLNN